MSAKPKNKLRRPGKTMVPEEKAAHLETRWESAERTTPAQSHTPTELQGHRATASPGTPEAPHVARAVKPRGGGTREQPYQRNDGTVTRSTTVHLPVELLQRLKKFSAVADRRMSDVATEAIRRFLEEVGA